MAQKLPPSEKSEIAVDATPAQSPSADTRKVCGIVMPIAAMGDRYPEAHWTRVRLILQRAIERAGMRYQLVWENPEVDVIQSAILQNLYENDVVICDVSNLNPNVMLETGLRLSTKRPTIIVTDKELRPPFDISTIGYLDYQRDLEYNSIESFINKLSRKIEEVTAADTEGRYQSYIQQFRFETVQPTSVTVSSDDYLRERLDDLTSSVRQLIRSQQGQARTESKKTPQSTKHVWKIILTETADMTAQQAKSIENQIDDIPFAVCTSEQVGYDSFNFTVKILSSSESETASVLSYAKGLIANESSIYVPF